MSSLWFYVDAQAVQDACSRIEWVGLLLIFAGVIGMLFGMFWVAFSLICVLVGVGTGLNIALLLIAGGLGPILGASVVLALGITRRLQASRLRDLRTLAHGRRAVSVEQVSAMLGANPAAAQSLLRKACELGVAAPAAPGA